MSSECRCTRAVQIINTIAQGLNSSLDVTDARRNMLAHVAACRGLCAGCCAIDAPQETLIESTARVRAFERCGRGRARIEYY